MKRVINCLLICLQLIVVAFSIPAEAQTTKPSIVTLSPNKSFATQVKRAGCVYRIQYNFDLNKKTVKIPDNCVLLFEGGSILNGTIDLNQCEIKGQGIKCKIKNPGDYSYSLSYYLSDTKDPELNRAVVQTLLDAKVPVIVDFAEMTFSGYLSINSGCVVQSTSNRRSILKFPNSKGFVWDKKVYSQNNAFQGIFIQSEDNCFDFVNGGEANRPINVYFSTFRNIKAQSVNGDCFYAGVGNYGANGNDCTFDNLFEDIEVNAPKGSGFVGLSSNTQHFLKVRCIECGVACFYNCSGIFDSCNGTFGNTPKFFIGTRRSQNSPARYSCVFRNCNIESYKSVLFSCKDQLCYMELTFENCSFYMTPNKHNIIDYYPFDFDYLFYLRMRNNKFYRLKGGEYDSVHSLFRIGSLSNVICFDVDQDIVVSDGKANKKTLFGREMSLKYDESRPQKPSIGDYYFDTRLGKPIWWNGKKWIDATGNVIPNS